MEKLTMMLKTVDGWIWGTWMMALLVGVHIFYSFITNWVQVRHFGHCMAQTVLAPFKRGKKRGDGKSLSAFQTLCVSLGSCVGSGNVVGVATAIIAGGLGAVFWMCFAAFFGMATKFGEIILAILFREKREDGEWVGGIMYCLKNGCKRPKLGAVAAVGTILFYFGSRMLQANTVSGVMSTSFGVPGWITGLVLSAVMLAVAAGGHKRLGEAASLLVPVMTLLFLGIGGAVLVARWEQIPAVLARIFSEAFSLRAAAGGAGGYMIARAMQYGVARGLYSNAAGVGCAGFYAAASDVEHPVEQGIFGVTEVFIDTIVVCTMTGLVIGVTGVVDLPGASASTMAIDAFASVWSPLGFLGAVSLLLFCFTTLMGHWMCLSAGIDYLFPKGKVSKVVKYLFPLLCFPGAVLASELVWTVQDIAQACMALPNLFALVLLAPLVRGKTIEYFEVVLPARKAGEETLPEPAPLLEEELAVEG